MNRTTFQSLRSTLQTASCFTALQSLILLLVLVDAWTCSATQNDQTHVPALNDDPRTVLPQYNYSMVISDEQLAAVLDKLHPKFLEQPTKINFVDHAIRMWGVDAIFSDQSLSGREMLDLLVNHQSFASVWKDSPPLLEPTKIGVSVTTQQGRSSVSHVDHMMGTLAEIGVPLTHPVQTFRGETTVRAILENSLLNFRLNQREYEWTALAAAFYAKTGSPWHSVEGQRIDFNVLAKRLMRQSQPQGVCYGMHRIYSLTMLLRIDDQIRNEGTDSLLADEARDQVMTYLLEMTRRLYHNQSVQGYWDGNWADTSRSVPDPTTDELSRRILATGHVLEWWAMAPKELHPPRATIVSAGQWLATEITLMDPHKVEKNFTFLTHAGRALALWRATSPSEYEQNHRPGSFLVTPVKPLPTGLTTISDSTVLP